MSERFFLAVPPASSRARLEGDEARHLARVLRAAPGDEVRVFDGRGTEWPARLLRVDRDEVELELGPARTDPPCHGPSLALAVALPKGERQKWLVEKLTELGVDVLLPLVTERGVAEASPAACARLARTALEACKQCGRNTLPEIAAPVPLAGVLAGLGGPRRGLLADPAGGPLDAEAVRAAGVTELVALVGPEGGFTPAERARIAAAGCVPVTLGPHVLRVETAAVALAARLARG